MTGETPASMPIPQGLYVPARRHGGFIFTSGMTPRSNGRLILTGQVSASVPKETYKEAMELACENALTAARSLLKEGEAIAAVVSMTVFIAAEQGFANHSGLADLASQYLATQLGDAGVGSRAAVGVATLPGNAPFEIQLIAAV